MPLTIVAYGVYRDKDRVTGKAMGNERAERGKSIPGVRDQHQNVPVVCSYTKQLNPIGGNAPIGQRTQFSVG